MLQRSRRGDRAETEQRVGKPWARSEYVGIRGCTSLLSHAAVLLQTCTRTRWRLPDAWRKHQRTAPMTVFPPQFYFNLNLNRSLVSVSRPSDVVRSRPLFPSLSVSLACCPSSLPFPSYVSHLVSPPTQPPALFTLQPSSRLPTRYEPRASPYRSVHLGPKEQNGSSSVTANCIRLLLPLPCPVALFPQLYAPSLPTLLANPYLLRSTSARRRLILGGLPCHCPDLKG